MTTIRNITPALMRWGNIKIGKKGKFVKSKTGKNFQLPEKLDHFLITTMEKSDGENTAG